MRSTSTSGGHNVEFNWHDGASEGELIRSTSQVITDEFLDEIDAIRKIQAARGRMGEYVHVARIPRILYDKWVAEGFDPVTCSAMDLETQIQRLRAIVARLKAEGYEKFVVTDKSI